jgi:predicted nucleic acid-binding protein
MVLVDTTVWIDYVHGTAAPHTDALDYALLEDQVVTGDLIVAEFLQGFRTAREFNDAKSIIDRLVCYELAGKPIAVQAARNFHFLRAKGITVRKTIDMIIGTFCIEHALPLLHNDHDFDPMEAYLGLKIFRLS